LIVYAPRKAVRDVLRISGVDRVIPVLGADALPGREARAAGEPDAAQA
jgi:hypothetical protein